MRNIASLSLEQAPPYHVPLRFFVTAPVFAMVAALVLMFAGPAAFASRWSPALLAVTHLLTLGYVSMVMLGAMLQMLPVLAGVPVRRVVFIGSTVHLFIVTGSLLLAGGFLWHQSSLLLAAAGLLATGLVFCSGVCDGFFMRIVPQFTLRISRIRWRAALFPSLFQRDSGVR